ncbi:MAG TPA: epimerase, partial [Candidatus Angelobacter sp.]|nr:epimerase [Candidatus Angelobacter sp.]
MKLLVLGGTQFVGRRIVEAALERGHAVTLFHRGTTNPGLFTESEEILGDRDGGLGALSGLRWDAVLDVNGYVPRLVRDSVRALTGDPGTRYLFISTLSVLATFTIPHQTEATARVSFEGIDTETITNETYGPLKAACEDVVEREIPGRHVILRPGFIVGPWDHIGRFNYWLRRFSEGGTMLVPGTEDSPVQVIDARDLGAFAIHALEARKEGLYHTIGPKDPTTWGDVFEETRRLTGVTTSVEYVAEEFLSSRGVTLPMRSHAV